MEKYTRNPVCAEACRKIDNIMHDMMAEGYMNSIFIGADGVGANIIHHIDTDEDGLTELMAFASRVFLDLLKLATEEEFPSDDRIEEYGETIVKSMKLWRDEDMRNTSKGPVC